MKPVKGTFKRWKDPTGFMFWLPVDMDWPAKVKQPGYTDLNEQRYGEPVFLEPDEYDDEEWVIIDVRHAHVLYECEICGGFHLWEWAGDCREPGCNIEPIKGDEIRSMADRITADQGFPPGSPVCDKCGNPFDDNPGKTLCQTCEDWKVTN